MKIPLGHFRHFLLFYFLESKNAVQARKKLCDVYCEMCLTERQCLRCFAHIRSGDFSLNVAPRSDFQLKSMTKKKLKTLSKLTGAFRHKSFQISLLYCKNVFRIL